MKPSSELLDAFNQMGQIVAQRTVRLGNLGKNPGLDRVLEIVKEVEEEQERLRKGLPPNLCKELRKLGAHFRKRSVVSKSGLRLARKCSVMYKCFACMTRATLTIARIAGPISTKIWISTCPPGIGQHGPCQAGFIVFKGY